MTRGKSRPKRRTTEGFKGRVGARVMSFQETENQRWGVGSKGYVRGGEMERERKREKERNEKKEGWIISE